MPKSTIERLQEQTAIYQKQYQEQRRLSPEELGVLTDETLRVQAAYINELESEIKDLRHQLGWANKMSRAMADALQSMLKRRGGTVWVPNARATKNQEEENARSTRGGDLYLEGRAREGGEQPAGS